MSRVMGKVFSVESTEKGSPLQSKINGFTKGKNITDVHALSVANGGGSVKATLIYEVDDAEGASSPRLYAKVLENLPVGSELQTKVNAFSKGKDLDVKAADVALSGDTATVVLVYAKNDEDGAE